MKRDFYDNPGMLISYINQMSRRFVDNALREEYGLNNIMYTIANGILLAPGCSQDYISDRHCIDKTTIARSAQKLEKMGFISRETLPDNRRQYSLQLTEEGSKMAQKVCDARLKWVEEIRNTLSEAELTQLMLLLNKLADGVDASSAH